MTGLMQQMLLYSAQEHGILPLTSACNVRCIFCSNHQNPPGVEVFNLPPLKLAAVEEILDFLVPQGKVIIGEAATRINEGEPFTHPQIREILALVRERFPAVPIQITSNGSLLGERMAAYLAAVGPVEINLSLNSADPAGRARLMGERGAADAVRAAEYLTAAGVPYHGSMVAMPGQVGWGNMEGTIAYFQATGAKTVRVFLPGYTDLAPAWLRFPPGLHGELQEWVSRMREKYSVPILLEPPRLTDLAARVEGIIAGSPAAAAGLKTGDIILRVDGQAVRTRVEAFERVLAKAAAALTVQRAGQVLTVRLAREREERPGFVLSYDIDPKRLDAAARAAGKHRARRVLYLTSALAAPFLRPALEQTLPPEPEWRLTVCANRFFDGSIMAAGLLTAADFIAAVRETAASGWQPDLLVLPATPFDWRGRDLTGQSYRTIGEACGVPVELT